MGERLRLRSLAGKLDGVLDRIVHEVESTGPGMVIVDSFRTVVRSVEDQPSAETQFQSFIQRLPLHLTGWQAMTFLVGECTDPRRHPRRDRLAVGSDHSEALRSYDITSEGTVMGDYLHEFRGVITGVPRIREELVRSPWSGLGGRMSEAMQALAEAGEASSADVAEAMGVVEREAGRLLDRLVELRYALRTGDRYRPAGRPLE